MAIWRIDPDTLLLTGGPTGPMSAQEFAEQTWPSCPVCSAQIAVDRIEVTTYSDLDAGLRTYVMGCWACPNECDPRRADPRRTPA